MAVVLLFSIPIHIDKTLSAVEIKLDDPSYLQECTITITGSYHLNLFVDDTFEGAIAVSGYSQTLEKISPVHFSKEGCPLFYRRFKEGFYDEDGRLTRFEYCLGRIMSGRFFHNVIIVVFSNNPLDKDGGWKEHGSWGGWMKEPAIA